MNLDEFKAYKEECVKKHALRYSNNDPKVNKKVILFCSSSGCYNLTTTKSIELIKSKLNEVNLKNQVSVEYMGCMGLCSLGPIVMIMPDGVVYTHFSENDANRLVDEHILGGKILEDKLAINDDGITAKALEEIDLFKKQTMVALGSSKYIDPTSIDSYVANGGYSSLIKAYGMSQEAVINEVLLSNLRGRGGAGFLTGAKWKMAFNENDNTKFIVCNADEGDPGAFMDRAIMESNPFCILEAMTIAGYAIGAKEGVIYVRAEYTLAVDRLKNAIESAYKMGFLGSNIFGSNNSFFVTIKKGAGAFVCGEETALIHSIEGNRGEPTIKPPYPTHSGLHKKPTVVNNVETLANIPLILKNGAAWYNSIGTLDAGTKVFALSGKIKNAGLVEMPMGTTLREVIYCVGGGGKNGKKIKAVQLGGPSGGCIMEKNFDEPISYNNLKRIGAMMGSGGMVVIDEDTCMVDFAKYFVEFTCDESCGKCTACRIGTKRILELLNKITSGKANKSDLLNLWQTCHYVKENSLCGLGQSAPNPVISTMVNFFDEYEAHVYQKRCPAHQCKDLIEYKINASKCKGCSLCSRKCPVNAITGEVGKAFYINKEKCIKCGQCYESCKFGAVERS